MSSRPHSYRWYLLGAVIGVLALGVWWTSSAGPTVVVDLVTDLPNAAQRRPSPEAFRVQDVSLGGVTKRAIYVAEPSRLIYNVTVPQDGWLQVSLGVREEAWARDGTGVLFMAGVSLDGRYDELVSLIVNPYSNPADRQWMPVLLDLAPWAGQTVEVVLNTRVAHPAASLSNHLAVWGEPAIVTR